MEPIRSAAELYAHAIAIEREAAERYSQLAERMDDEGRDELARIFAELARMEAGHLETLERRTEGLDLPEVPDGEYRWLPGAAPETAPLDLVLRVLTPRGALAISLAAERRAQAFFERIFWSLRAGRRAEGGRGEGIERRRSRRRRGLRTGNPGAADSDRRAARAIAGDRQR